MRYKQKSCIAGVIGLVFILFSSASWAFPSTSVDDLDIISLNTSEPSVQVQYNYPGLGPQPDCLVLYTNTPEVTVNDDGNLEKFADLIEVLDGRGILFENGEVNRLIPEWHQVYHPFYTERIVVYKLKDLHKYVTGLEVKSRDGSTLQQVLNKAFGANFRGKIGLQVVRSCRTILE